MRMGGFSLQELTGTILAIVVPALLWCWRVSANQKACQQSIDALTDLHFDEDSVFSTKQTNRLLDEHIRAEKDMHRSMEGAISALNSTIRELTHYIRWQTTQTTGKKPPPFIDS
jgi:hypothetical protein